MAMRTANGLDFMNLKPSDFEYCVSEPVDKNAELECFVVTMRFMKHVIITDDIAMDIETACLKASVNLLSRHGAVLSKPIIDGGCDNGIHRGYKYFKVCLKVPKGTFGKKKKEISMHLQGITRALSKIDKEKYEPLKRGHGLFYYIVNQVEQVNSETYNFTKGDKTMTKMKMAVIKDGRPTSGFVSMVSLIMSSVIKAASKKDPEILGRVINAFENMTDDEVDEIMFDSIIKNADRIKLDEILKEESELELIE